MDKAKRNERWICIISAVVAVALVAAIVYSLCNPGGATWQRSSELSRYLQVDPKVTDKREDASMDLLPRDLEGFEALDYHYFFTGPREVAWDPFTFFWDDLTSDAPVTYSLLLKTKPLSEELEASEKQRILADSRFQRYELASGELYADEWTVRHGIDDATDGHVYDGYSSPVYFVYFPYQGEVIYCEAYYFDALEKDPAVLEVLQALHPEVLELQETLPQKTQP